MSKFTIRNSYRTITNPELRKQGADWFITYSYRNDGQGRTYSGRERLGAIARDEARVALEAWKTTQAKSASAIGVRLLDEILTPYETAKLRNRQRAARSYLSNVHILRQAYGHFPIHSINAILLNDLRIARGVSKSAERTYAGTLNAAFAFAIECRLIKPDDWLPLKRTPDAERREHHLERAEAETVYARAMGESVGKAKLAPITKLVALALDTGARAEALEELTFDRVNFKTNLIDFRVPGVLYTNKRRVQLKIAARLRPILERAFHERASNDEPVIGSQGASKLFNAWVRSIPEWRGTPIAKTTLHCLRHTFATLLLTERNFPLHKVAVLLGDNMQTVEKHYAHLLPSNTDFDL